jgi:hypothetical protein
MSENYVDFKQIKEVVSIEIALSEMYNYLLRKVNAVTLRGSCPLPTHPFGISDDSFSVNTEKQVWICHNPKCQKTRKGRKGGDVIELIAVLENCTLREAGVKLGEVFLSDKVVAQIPAVKVTQNQPQHTEYELYYQPLVDWINDRLVMSISAYEKTAYISVLGRIEEVSTGFK